MSFRHLLPVFSCIFAFVFPSPSIGEELIQVVPQPGQDVHTLRHIAPGAGDCGTSQIGEKIEFVATTKERKRLEALGYQVEVVVPDLVAQAQQGIRGDGAFGAYHTFDEAIAAMDAIAAAHPNIMSAKMSIGQSVEGREIYVYKISDNPNVDEDEPEIFFNSYIHAREAMTFEVLLGTVTRLTSDYATDPYVQGLVDDREIFFAPVLNPDGLVYNELIEPNGGGLWRKNRRDNGDGTFGVDLNRNFSYEWGRDDIGSSPDTDNELYRGPAPFSEPETRAVRDFVLARDFSIIINLHSFGRQEMFSPEFAAVSLGDYDEHLALARARHESNNYFYGPTWHLLYLVNGGATDWMARDVGAYSIITEIGLSFWPPETQIPEFVNLNVPANLEMIDYADDPRRALIPAVAEVLDPGPVGPDFWLQWIDPNSDPSNVPTTWNVIEATGRTLGADDMEGDIDTNWRNRRWLKRSNEAASGEFSLRACYTADSNFLLESKRSYRVQPGDQLRFQAWYDLPPHRHYLYVEVATEPGGFESISGNLTTDHNPFGINTGNGITGTTNGDFVEGIFDLSDYVGQTIWIRFHGVTESTFVGAGFYLDDVSPMHLFETETVIAEVSGTKYLIEDRADGLYSYMVQASDAESDISALSVPVDVSVGDAASVPQANSESAWSGVRSVGRHPFRSHAMVAFDIPHESRAGEVVEVSLHDAQGRQMGPSMRGVVGESWRTTEVEDLRRFGREDLAPGSSTGIRWQPSGVESGVYFVTVRVGSKQSTRQFVLLP